MPATVSAAVKARLESQGLSLAVYRGGAPANASYPHVVVHEGIGTVELAEASGDLGDPATEVTVREELQVDLYQLARTVSTTQGRVRNAEDYTLLDRIATGLRGARLGAIGVVSTGAVVSRIGTRRRWPIKDNVVRATLSIFVDRPVQRSAAP
jgi:hypothetical protein